MASYGSEECNMIWDSDVYMALKRQDLLIESDRERLARQLPRRRSAVRRALAVGCHRLADWLDDPKRYLQPSETAPAYWAAHSSGV